MSVFLDSYDLGNVIMQDAWDSCKDSVVEKSVFGSPIVFSKSRTYKDLTLIGGENWGILKKKILDDLLALAQTDSVLTLQYHNEEYIVMFRNDDVPVIDGERVSPYDPEGLMRNIIIKLRVFDV